MRTNHALLALSPLGTPTRANGWSASIRARLAACCILAALPAAGSERVSLQRAPEGGIQPQAVVDESGDVHLIYYKGDPGGGDVFYARQSAGGSEFSKPIRVNRQPGSAMAAGSIRGAQLAVGRNKRPHVAWDGLGKGATQVASTEGKTFAPFLYSRLNDAGAAFEPERNLITYASGLDGGGSVAADRLGNVYVAWHASNPGNTNGEAGRSVFIARSSDDGRTFQRETPALNKATGACGCCGMKAFADASGAVYLLYRAASEMVNRGEMLLVSPRPGAEFQIVNAHPWKIAACPMSSAWLSEGNGGALAAWETAGQVYFAAVNAATQQVSPPVAPPGSAKRKHPVAIVNKKGETLVVWTEGTGWAKGGSVVWQLYDAAGTPASENGRADGVPVWSLVTAYARPDQTFVIVY
ncbi:MAG: hypothetical protein HYR88_13375 [Verrucomicrobia bacterium]|nr:hypothetical protein [Verrucomicrobiota bacterium]MBI3869962.1 hypothetical protein [Verrucomicrobiota bacterium]